MLDYLVEIDARRLYATVNACSSLFDYLETGILTQEKVRAVTASRSEIKFTVIDDTLEKLKQLKDLIGDQSLEKIFDQVLDSLLLTEKQKRGVMPFFFALNCASSFGSTFEK